MYDLVKFYEIQNFIVGFPTIKNFENNFKDKATAVYKNNGH